MEEFARLITPFPPVQMRPPRLQVRHGYLYGCLLISKLLRLLSALLSHRAWRSRARIAAPFASFADRCTSVSDKEYFPYESQCGPLGAPPARPGISPEGVLAVVCLDNPRDNTWGKALWTSLPSLEPQEECHGVCQMLYRHGWSVTL